MLCICSNNNNWCRDAQSHVKFLASSKLTVLFCSFHVQILLPSHSHYHYISVCLSSPLLISPYAILLSSLCQSSLGIFILCQCANYSCLLTSFSNTALSGRVHLSLGQADTSLVMENVVLTGASLSPWYGHHKTARPLAGNLLTCMA